MLTFWILQLALNWPYWILTCLTKCLAKTAFEHIYLSVDFKMNYAANFIVAKNWLRGCSKCCLEGQLLRNGWEGVEGWSVSSRRHHRVWSTTCWEGHSRGYLCCNLPCLDTHLLPLPAHMCWHHQRPRSPCRGGCSLYGGGVCLPPASLCLPGRSELLKKYWARKRPERERTRLECLVRGSTCTAFYHVKTKC